VPGHRYNSSLAAIKHFETRFAAKPRLKILSGKDRQHPTAYFTTNLFRSVIHDADLTSL